MTKDTNSSFIYELDDLIFTCPWTKPNMFQLKLWFQDMKIRFSDFCGFELLLWGGFWSSDFSWDIDIFVVSKEVNPTPGLLNIGLDQLESAHDLISAGFKLAIEQHRFLVDITFASWLQVNTIAEAYRKFTAGEIGAIDISPEINCGLGIHKTIRKFRDGDCIFDVNRQSRKVLRISESKIFYEKMGGTFDKQVRHLRNGRIYYEPVRLSDLFS